MFTRGIASCLSMGIASTALGAVRVELTKIPDRASYTANEVVSVEVRLRQDPPGSAHLLRYVAFDLNNSSGVCRDCPTTACSASQPCSAQCGPCLNVRLPRTHDKNTQTPVDDIHFWNFNTVFECGSPQDPDCGKAHLVDSDLTGSRPNLISVAYYGDLAASNLQDAPNLQLNLPASASLLIGRLEVTMPNPMPAQCMTLDLLNAPQTNPDAGGEVRYGFGVAAGDPILGFRANTGGLVGGTTQFCSDGCNSHLVLNQLTYPCDSSLPRLANNTIRLPFNAAIAAPTSGQVRISTIGAGGGFGPDLSASFTFSVLPGNILKIVENGTVFANGTWYAIRNDGTWPGVCDFEVTYVAVTGDSDNTLLNDFADLSFIFGNLTGAASDTDRSDMDASTFVDFADITFAFGFNGSTAPLKPGGHACVAE